MKESGSFNAKDFKKYLEDNPDKVMVISKDHFMNLDNLIETEGATKIRLSKKPENLVFGE